MSHIVTIKTEVRDAAAVRAACQRLHLPQPIQGTHRLFTSSATGLAVALPKWRYPAVCDLETGGRSSTTTSVATGASKNISTRFSKATPWKRPKSRPDAKGTFARNSRWPTVPSS